MVSVGVQNEAGALVGILPKTKKPKTKTIMLMDAAIQTGKHVDQQLFLFSLFYMLGEEGAQ